MAEERLEALSAAMFDAWWGTVREPEGPPPPRRWDQVAEWEQDMMRAAARAALIFLGFLPGYVPEQGAVGRSVGLLVQTQQICELDWATAIQVDKVLALLGTDTQPAAQPEASTTHGGYGVEGGAESCR